MKKTISVNLANRNFYIEEDAYNMLDEYIKSIREHYHGLDPDGEVAQDFEIRLSELFDEKLRLGYTVVSVGMASDVIRQLGNIDELKEEAFIGGDGGDSMDDEAPESEHSHSTSGEPESANTESHEATKLTRKLFREPRGKVLAGVFSGLAKYLDTDPMILRLIFVILLFTPAHVVSVVLYIAGWLFLPVATTAADRLAMEGREVTSENLWSKIAEESFDGDRGRVIPGANEEGDEGSAHVKKKSSKNWLWWIVALVALVGAIATLTSLIVAIDDGWLTQFSFLPPAFDTGITIFAAIILVVCIIGLGLLIAGVILYVLAVLPIGVIIKSKKITPQLKVILIIAWLLLLTIWIW